MTPQERKVFELALEALKANHLLIHGSETKGGLSFCMDGYYSGCFDIDSNDKQTNEAITAIEEVLAQPEQIPPSAYSNTHQPEQEPHSWYSKQEDEWMTHKTRKEHERLNSYTHKVGKFDLALYTTPPQPEPEPCDMKEMCIGCSPRNADGNCPDAQQEPVAWLHVMDNTEGLKANGTGIVLITQKRKHPFGKPGIDFSKSYPVTSTPLYTTPPQRKPLTDEHIGVIAIKSQDGISPHDDTLRFARAIEAAHGIKE